MSIKGKHALVTGSSRGIGRGIAVKLAENGLKVAVNYRENERAAKQTLETIRETGSDGFAIRADVSQAEDIRRMFDKVENEFGGLDVFVSSALGELFSFYQSPLELTSAQWDKASDSQGKAFVSCCHQATALMKEGGRIVAITYAVGAETGSWQPYIAMASAKAALESACRYFAVALAKRGITVNVVSPGITEDSVVSLLPPEAQEAIRSWHVDGWCPMGRLGTPFDIGDAVALLCSEEARWITGQVIKVDGGQSLMNSDFPLEIQRG